LCIPIATRFRRLLKVVEFNANCIGKQRFELCKQLQDHRIDKTHLWETHPEPNERSFIPNCHVFSVDHSSGLNGEIAIAVRKCISHNPVELPPVFSREETGICVVIGNREVLLTPVYNSLGRARNDADVTDFLRFRSMSSLAGDMNAKNPVWNSKVSNPLREKLLNIFDNNDFQTSAPPYPTARK